MELHKIKYYKRMANYMIGEYASDKLAAVADEAVKI